MVFFWLRRPPASAAIPGNYTQVFEPLVCGFRLNLGRQVCRAERLQEVTLPVVQSARELLSNVRVKTAESAKVEQFVALSADSTEIRMLNLKRMPTVFISYSRNDEAVVTQLKKHFALLIRENEISAWYDREILAGARFDERS